ncbi:MAG: hypothetical protein M3Y87_21990, partial [Myxococcota bacterium]|nr:hypothetical protein [Myxococcota bacterium]
MAIQRVLAVVVAFAAALGFSFAAVSTSDFVAHLDRQVHGIHCSFLPGVDAPDVTGSSGCAVTLMSPYSSILRESVWGGIPISLPAMAVFAFLAFVALALLVTRRTGDRRATAFLALATAVPLLTSIVMGWIALRELDAACKLCIGIYVSSAVAFFAALVLAIRARRRTPALHQRLGPAPRIAARGKQLDDSTYDDARSDGNADSTVREESPYALGTADTLQATPDQARRLATESEMERRLGASPA